MITVAGELQTLAVQVSKQLRGRSDEWAATPRIPGKWSPKEIIGHLIDSASNNHQRFVRACFQPDLVFSGYDQDAWVSLQRPQETDWHQLLTLWESFNLHISRLMNRIPEEIRTKMHDRHNLDQIAWETVPASEPVTLDYFMRDYVGHLKHHLRQIDPMLASAPQRQR